jgi:hypothetical protein
MAEERRWRSATSKKDAGEQEKRGIDLAERKTKTKTNDNGQRSATERNATQPPALPLSLTEHWPNGSCLAVSNVFDSGRGTGIVRPKLHADTAAIMMRVRSSEQSQQTSLPVVPL